MSQSRSEPCDAAALTAQPSPDRSNDGLPGLASVCCSRSPPCWGLAPPWHRPPPGSRPAAITLGDSLFHSKGNCYACHGANAQGAVGPNLTDAEWIHSDGSYDAIVKQITTGVTAEESKSKIPMPPKGGSQITDDEVEGGGGIRLLAEPQEAVLTRRLRPLHAAFEGRTQVRPFRYLPAMTTSQR